MREVTFPAVARGEEWAWTIRLGDNPRTVIGAISVFDRPNDNRGFWLGRDWQGQGLMTEACSLATDYWFDVLGFPLMREPKALANTSSRRLSEREGMRLIEVGHSDFVGGRLPFGIWETTAAEWRSRAGRSVTGPRPRLRAPTGDADPSFACTPHATASSGMLAG
jgi:RimJ/RimL family protein N-acetyltransferase